MAPLEHSRTRGTAVVRKLLRCAMKAAMVAAEQPYGFPAESVETSRAAAGEPSIGGYAVCDGMRCVAPSCVRRE